MGVRIIWRCFFEIKYVHAKRAEERTLRVFLCPRAVRAAACSAKADGTERCVGRGVSRARTSEPPFSNRGVQIGIDQRISQNFEYFSCINGGFTDKYGENGRVSAKAIHCKVENDN